VSAQKTFEVPNRGESAGAAGRITLIGHTRITKARASRGRVPKRCVWWGG
jgi:hypothetical protein